MARITMFQPQKFLAFLFLTNCFYNGDSTSSYAPDGDHEYPDHHRLITFSENHEQLFYMTCKYIYQLDEFSNEAAESDDIDSVLTTFCNFNMQTQKGDESHVRTCDNYKLDQSVELVDPQIINDKMVLITHSTSTNSNPSDKSVLDSYLTKELKIFDFDDCSFSTTLGSASSRSESFGLAYSKLQNDHLNLFVNSKSICKVENRLCQVSYDLKGTSISQPKLLLYSSPGSSYRAAQVNDYDSNEGYYLDQSKPLGHDSGYIHWTISHVDSAGKSKGLLSQLSIPQTAIEYPTVKYENFEYSLWAALGTQYSTSHERYGLCGFSKIILPKSEKEYRATDVTCLQLDTHGVTLNATLEVDKTTLAVGVHNLPNNEMLIATGNMMEGNGTTVDINSINIFKFGKNISSSKSLQIRGLDVKCDIDGLTRIAISEKTSDKICVHIACLLPVTYGSFQYGVKCISKDQLM